jgi:hypothetical protein
MFYLPFSPLIKWGQEQEAKRFHEYAAKYGLKAAEEEWDMEQEVRNEQQN